MNTPRTYELIGVNESDTSVSSVTAPVNPDPEEFNVLKFYEMNSHLLETINNTTWDLPFKVTEDESLIINKVTTPPASMLLLGRSGTGKTTCTVLRMLREYNGYKEQAEMFHEVTEEGDECDHHHLRQLFITNSSALRSEVMNMFSNVVTHNHNIATPDEIDRMESLDGIEDEKFPLFLSNCNWLMLLDKTLPGNYLYIVCCLSYKLIVNRFNMLQEVRI